MTKTTRHLFKRPTDNSFDWAKQFQDNMFYTDRGFGDFLIKGWAKNIDYDGYHWDIMRELYILAKETLDE